MQKILFLLMLCFFSPSTLIYASKPIKPLDLSISHHTIGKFVLMYEDRNTSMKLSDITKLSENAFKRLNRPVSSNNFSDSAFWYKFKVVNSENSTRTRLIVFEPPWLDSIAITVISSDGKIQTYEGGNTFPYNQRAIDHHLINFKHSFDVGLSTVYIQVKTRDPFIVSISLMEESEFLSEQSVYSFWIGFIYGGIIAMLLYNLFLYFGIKKRYYAFYVLNLFTFLLMNATYNGYTFMWIFSQYPEVQNWAQAIFIYFFVLTSFLFARSFLNLKTFHPTLYTVTTYFIYSILFICFFSVFVGSYHFNVILSIMLVMLKSIYIVGIALFSWINGNRSARFYLLGATSGLVGAFVTALTVMSFIPYTYVTYKASDIGMFIDVVLLSIALVDRIKMTHDEKLMAEKEAKTDILTGLLNRRAYYEIINSEHRRLIRYRRDFSVIILDIDDFKEVNDTYGHNEGDMLLKNVASVIKENMRESDYAFRLGGDEFVIFLPETNENQAYQIAQHVRKEIENINLEYNFPIGSSLGISQFNENDENLESTLKRADKALYDVKRSGKNQVRVWSKNSF